MTNVLRRARQVGLQKRAYMPTLLINPEARRGQADTGGGAARLPAAAAPRSAGFDTRRWHGGERYDTKAQT
jgi:hypothetical protein